VNQIDRNVSMIKSWFQQSDEDKELDDYVLKIQIYNIIKFHRIKIKIGFFVVELMISIIISIYYFSEL